MRAMPTVLTHRGAIELRDLIASGQVSCVQVVEQHIALLSEVNPQLNAMVFQRFDAAREEARLADARQQSGLPLGLLHGVPFTVKECLSLTGTASTFGVGSRVGHRADFDELQVARLRAAGAIPIAKSNVSQLLLYYESDNPVFGRTLNPHDATRTPGGSSGGEAALIAVGASPLGLGTDIGGSVRVPAAFCGIVSLKPTSGRCDDEDDFWGPRGQQAVKSQVGVMARSVADVELGLQVINGGQAPSRPAQPLHSSNSIQVSALKVAFYTDDGTFGVSPAVARAVHEAAAALQAGGAKVTAWTPPDASRALRLYYGIMGADGMQSARQCMKASRKAPQIARLLALAAMPRFLIRLLMPVLRRLGQPSLAEALRAFGSNSTAEYWSLLRDQADYQASFADALARAPGGPFDVILCPPCALPAYTHGSSNDLLTAGAYAVLYNLLGYPAGVVPVTRVRAGEESNRTPLRDWVQGAAARVEVGSVGLPVGVQVVALPWQEHVALAAMKVIEAAAKARHDFKPPVGVAAQGSVPARTL